MPIATIGGHGPSSGLARRGPVGFMPQIQTLPQGASMSATPSLAVVSADRRFVRTSPMPFCSQIGEVTTFNFGAQGDDDDNSGDDDDNGGDNDTNN